MSLALYPSRVRSNEVLDGIAQHSFELAPRWRDGQFLERRHADERKADDSALGRERIHLSASARGKPEISRRIPCYVVFLITGLDLRKRPKLASPRLHLNLAIE